MTISQSKEASPTSTPGNYSAFSTWQKRCIIGLAAFAGWFSSVSSFIYFPAIPFIAHDLDVGVGKINLTVTSYLIMSGIFPSIMGDAADRFGRRPVFLAGLGLYLIANVGLALQSHFGLLFFLRMVQSAGISGTFSITYGVLSDLFTPAERGAYSGAISFFLNTPPSLGPLLSGLLLLRWRWPSIFWFLSAATPLCLIPMLLFLPETARRIVHDGSKIPINFLNRAPISILFPAQLEKGASGTSSVVAGKRGFLNPLAALKLVRRPNTAIILVAYAVNYAVYSCLQASISTIFQEVYHISGVVSGLIYLPFGVACAISAFATGKLLDINYRRTAKECNIPVDKAKGDSLDNFPIERARLRMICFSVASCSALVIGYGWLLRYRVSMVAPLVLQFFIGITIQSLFTSLNTLLVDIHQDCPSTAQAACNFFRCELSAACLAALDSLLRALGAGWCFVLLGLTLGSMVPFLVLLQKRGLAWRQLKSTGPSA